METQRWYTAINSPGSGYRVERVYTIPYDENLTEVQRAWVHQLFQQRYVPPDMWWGFQAKLLGGAVEYKRYLEQLKAR